MANSANDSLSEHLSEQGLDSLEIQAVLRKLDEYDKKIIHESVFDSIERGSFSLEAIIAEAMKDLSEQENDEAFAENTAVAGKEETTG